MVTLHEVITFLVSMQISISSLQTHNVNRCGRSRHLARKLSLRRKRSSPNVFEMAATETITSIILIKLIRVSLGTVRHPRRFKIVVIDIQITLKQMLRDFIGIRVNRAKKSGMVNITSSVNSRRSEERRVGKECRCGWSPDHEKKKAEHVEGREERDQLQQDERSRKADGPDGSENLFVRCEAANARDAGERQRVDDEHYRRLRHDA